MERITIKRLNQILGLYLNELGINTNKYPIKLDYVSQYGGWKLVQLLEDGGESDMLGSRRRQAKDMYDCLWFAYRSLCVHNDLLESKEVAK